MDELAGAGVGLEHLQRSHAAALDPVQIHLEQQGRGHPAHDVEDPFAVELDEVHVVVVVAQRDALLGEAGGVGLDRGGPLLCRPASRSSPGTASCRCAGSANRSSVQASTARSNSVSRAKPLPPGAIEALMAAVSTPKSGPAAHEVVDQLVGHLHLGDLDGVDVEIAHLAQHLVHPLLVDLVLEHHELESEDGHGGSPSSRGVGAAGAPGGCGGGWWWSAWSAGIGRPGARAVPLPGPDGAIRNGRGTCPRPRCA